MGWPWELLTAERVRPETMVELPQLPWDAAALTREAPLELIAANASLRWASLDYPEVDYFEEEDDYNLDFVPTATWDWEWLSGAYAVQGPMLFPALPWDWAVVVEEGEWTMEDVQNFVQAHMLSHYDACMRLLNAMTMLGHVHEADWMAEYMNDALQSHAGNAGA